MFALVLACAIPDDPTALYGLWANTDEDTVRVWDMAETHEETGELSPAYLIYNYDLGAEPNVAQVGAYDLREDHIVTSPLGEGVDYSNEIVAFRSGWFELEVDKTTGATRVYEAVDELP
jgi:hypothetical protein